MTIYRYRTVGAWVSRMMGFFWIVFPILFLTTAWYDLFSGHAAAMPPSTLIPLSIAMLLALAGGMALLNLFPDVAIRSDGLGVRWLLLLWLFVPWENVCSVRPPLVSIGKDTYLVQVRGLTLLHRLISLVYGLSLRPGFLLSPGIERHKELLQFIREHTDDDSQ